MSVYTSVTQLIGNTPLLELAHYENKYQLQAKVLAKLECFNPAGSSKDRVAFSMLTDAEEKGLLHPGSVIIEPTSGNTGIGLACAAVARGYKAVIVMPETMSVERQMLLRAYGAEVVLTKGGITASIEKAKELQSQIPGSFIAGQFENPANPEAHYRTTGPEIWQDTAGQVDIFVASVGTGGTLSGVGRYLKEMNPAVRIVAVEPAASPLLSEGRSGSHKIQGIGASFIPGTLDTTVYDEVIPVTDDDAFAQAREVARTEGLLVGISSGATLWAARELAMRPEHHGKTIVALFPDSGERYLSTTLYAE